LSPTGDARLDLADQVRADVGRLGVDAAAELGEQGHEAGAEAEADDLEGHAGQAIGQPLRGRGTGRSRVEAAEDGEDAQHAQQAEGHHQEAGDGAAAQGDGDGVLEADLRRGGGAQVGLDGDVHADEARQAGAEGAQQEGDGGLESQVEAAAGECRQQAADDDGSDDGEESDGAVLAIQERHRALEDHARDVLHRRRALVAAEDVARQVERERHREQPREQHHWPQCHRKCVPPRFPTTPRPVTTGVPCLSGMAAAETEQRSTPEGPRLGDASHAAALILPLGDAVKPASVLRYVKEPGSSH
jgi:hypothetical protein